MKLSGLQFACKKRAAGRSLPIRLGCPRVTHSFAFRYLLRVLLILASLQASVPARAALLDDFLAAADAGLCVERVVFRLLQQAEPDDAAAVIEAAIAAQTLRERQQRTLGCEGDIATQAIAAGADPAQVLRATAAGL